MSRSFLFSNFRSLASVSLCASLLLTSSKARCDDGPMEMNVQAKQVLEWGGRVPGETLSQGDDLQHVKIIFRQPDNPQKRSEIGISLKSDIPTFTKATMEVLSNVDTVFRIRLADASDNPFIAKVSIVGGTWTPVELVLDKSTGKSWPPLTPYKVLSLLATTKDGLDEQVLEIRNLRLSGGKPE